MKADSLQLLFQHSLVINSLSELICNLLMCSVTGFYTLLRFLQLLL